MSGNTHTNAGSYGSDAWTFTDVTGNYNDASGTVSDQIDKANATIAVTPYNVTYDGTGHAATGTATGVLGESLAGLDVSGTTHTDAGSYGSDAWTFTDVTGNYNDASGAVSDQIDKANATITVTPYDVTYDGAAHAAAGTATGVLGENLSGLDVSGTTHTNAGSYGSDAWTFTDVTGNYNDASGTVSDQIDKANATITVTPYNVTYDGTAHTASGTAKGVLGENLAGLDFSGSTHTNAGSYGSDAWTFTDVTGNYNDASGTVSDQIGKANATITVTPYSVTYDGAAHTASGTATGVLGENLAGLDASGTKHTNAGSYGGDAWIFTDVTGNYNDASGTVSDQIAKANATVTVTPYSVTYDGTSHTASGTATGVLGESLAGLDVSGTTDTNAGSYGSDAWTFTDVTGNYNDTSGTVSDQIAKANATITVTPYSVMYDGTAHTASGTATGVLGESLVGLDLSGTTHTNAGGYGSDAWTFTDVTGNYNDTSGTVSDQIAKANATITVTPYSVTYDGTAHTASGTATGVLGESLAGLDVSGTTHTNAGSYGSDAWTFTDVTGNYNDTSGTVSDQIAKANVTITVTPYSVTYDGTAHTASGTATGVLGESLVGLDLSGTTHTNAGTYSGDTWKFTDATGNYNDVSSTVSDQIAKANATIAITPYHVAYDATFHAATGTATGVLGESLAGLDLSGTSHTNAGIYTSDSWTFTDVTGNYNDASATVSDWIDKATLTITASTNTKTYDATNSAAAVPSVSVGLQGSDSVSGLVEVYSDANAGTGKTLHVSAYVVNDGNGGNNYAVTLVDDHTGVINPHALTITATTNTKTYDKTAAAAAVPSVSVGLQGSDSVSGLVEVYNDVNAGTGKTIRVSAYKVNDGNGGSNYAVTLVDNHTGVINPHALTITATTNTKIYDGTVSAAALPSVSVDLQGSDSVSGLAEIYTGSNAGTSKTLHVSAYKVNDGNGGSNYALVLVDNHTGVINPADLSVQADNQSKTYDGRVFSPFTVTISGFVNGETLQSSGVIGAAGFSGAATTAVNAGTYIVTPTKNTLHAANYDFPATNFTSGFLVVSQASLTVTFISMEKYVDEGNKFKVSYSPFATGDSPKSLNGTLTFTPNPPPFSPTGLYYITPGGLTSNNYDIHFVTGTLNIKPTNSGPGGSTGSDGSGTGGSTTTTATSGAANPGARSLTAPAFSSVTTDHFFGFLATNAPAGDWHTRFERPGDATPGSRERGAGVNTPASAWSLPVQLANNNTTSWAGWGDTSLALPAGPVTGGTGSIQAPETAQPQSDTAMSGLALRPSSEVVIGGMQTPDGNTSQASLAVSTTGVLLSAGYVLLSSSISIGFLGMLTARPVLLKGFDPVEVLFAWEKEKKRRSGSRDHTDEGETLQSLVK
jgi:hypothetical protein